MEKEKRQYFNIWSFALILLFFMISVFFLFIFLPKSFLPKDTLGIYLADVSYEDGNKSEVSIFEEDAFEKKLIHPLTKGSYSFAIYNNSEEENMPYELEFTGENLDNIPIVFSLQRNEKYIFGGKEKSEKIPLKEFETETIELDGRTTDIYKLEWTWETVSDESDTFIGNILRDQNYRLIIKARGFEDGDIISSDRITKVDDDIIHFRYLDIFRYLFLIILIILIFYAIHRALANMDKNVEKKSIKVIARNVIIGLLAIVLLVNIINVFNGVVLKQQVSTVCGYGGAMVLTGSMEPSIKPGDLIIMKKQKDYNVGDIITYRGENKSITHRIVERTANGFIVTGDANNREDGEIAKDLIVGKVVKIVPRFDEVLKVVNHPLVVGIPIIVFVILYKLIPCIRLRKEDPDSDISDCFDGDDKAPIVRYLLYLIILTTIVSSVSYAAYLESVEFNEVARVAKFDVDIKYNNSGYTDTNDFALLSNGDWKEFSINITNNSEVVVKVRALSTPNGSILSPDRYTVYGSNDEIIIPDSNGWFIMNMGDSFNLESNIQLTDYFNEFEFYFEYEQID